LPTGPRSVLVPDSIVPDGPGARGGMLLPAPVPPVSRWPTARDGGAWRRTSSWRP